MINVHKIYNSKRKIILCSIVFVLVMTSVALATNPLPVPQQQQSGKYTCWASVSSMISAFFNGNSTNNELSILLFVKGGPVDPDNPATAGEPSEVVTAVQEFAGEAGSIYNYAMSYNGIKWQINNDGPVAGGNSYHVVALKGYNDSTNSVIYNDPADGLGHSCSYNYFVNTWGFSACVFWQ